MADYTISAGYEFSQDLEYGDSCFVSSGGTLSHLKINAGAEVSVYEGGIIQYASNYGDLTVYGGGTMTNTELMSGTFVVVFAGAVTSDLFIHSGASMAAMDTIQDRTTVDEGGSLEVGDNITLVGPLTLEDNANFFTNSDSAWVVFNCSAVGPSSTPFINDISRVPYEFSYSIEFSDLPEYGSYTLAGNADDFDETISVKYRDFDDFSLTVGEGEVARGNRIFWLAKDDESNLLLKVAEASFFVNNHYTDGQIIPSIKGMGYGSIEAAWDAIGDANKKYWTILFTTQDPDVEQCTFTQDVVTKDYRTRFVGTEEANLDLMGGNIIVGDNASDVATADVAISYATNIGAIEFGNVTDTAILAIEHVNELGHINLSNSTVGNEQVTVSDCVIEEIHLPDNEKTAGSITIQNSTIGTLYGGSGDFTAHLEDGNLIENIYAEGHGDKINLVGSTVGTYMAGFSAEGTLESIQYHDGIIAKELILGGNINTISRINATFTGGTVGQAFLGGKGDSISDDIHLLIENGNLEQLLVGNENSIACNITLNIGSANTTDAIDIPKVIFSESATFASGSKTDVLFLPNGKSMTVGEFSIAQDSPMYGNVSVDFDLTAIDSESEISNVAMIGDLSQSKGVELSTITIGAQQTKGDYILADNAAGFEGTMTVKCGGQDDVSVTVGGPVVLGDNQAYSLAVSENNQLVFSVLGLDTFVNSDWTEADVTGSIIEGTELVWQKNAFNNLATAAAIVGSTNTLYIDGQWAGVWNNEGPDINLTGPSNVWIHAGTVCTVLEESIHGNGGTFHVDNDLTITKITGFSRVDIMGCELGIIADFDMPGDGILNFDVTKREVNATHAMLDIVPQHYGNLTITVSANQGVGSYSLLSYAGALDGKNIAVLGENKQQLGTLTVGGSDLVIGEQAYSVALDEYNTLIFTIKAGDTTPPDAPVAEASTTLPTNQNVTVTATFSTDSTVKEYSMDGTNWSAYTEGIVFSENGTVSFRGTDAAGNLSDVTSVAVTNIDKVPPDIPEISTNPEPGATTNGNVTVTAYFPNDVVLTQVSLDGVEWNDSSHNNVGQIEMTDNGLVYFRGFDAAGNFTEGSLEVTNIDKVAPEAPEARADVTGPTNQNVTVTATFSDDSTVKEYSTDGVNWSAYTDGIVFSENGTVSFRGTDAVGNVSEVADFVVANIDKIPPTAPEAEASTTAPTNQDVTVTATFSDDSTVKEYSTDGANWSAYTEGIVFSENGTVSFRGTDEAGNLSEVTDFVVANIDKVAPTVVSVEASETQPTNQDVVVTAAFTDNVGVALIQYWVYEGEWMTYSDGVTMDRNGAILFRAIDTAGNVSDTASLEVANIDKVPPEAPVATADGTWTLGNVTVTATFSDDSVVRAYSLDGADWSDYSEGIVFSENGTVFFRGTDAAGNDSEVTSYTVGNIVVPIVLDGSGSGTLTPDLPVAGAYGITGEFGDITGTVTIYNGVKKVGSGKVKKGVLSFNNGKAILLDSSLETTVEVKVQRGSALDYSVTLTPEKLFPKGDNSDDWTDLATKGAEGMVGHLQLGEEQSQVLSQDFKGQAVLEDWVGFSDAVDYKAFTLETGAYLSFDVTSSDATKFTIYELVPPSGQKLDPAAQLVRIAKKQLGRSTGSNKASSYSLSKKQTITLASQKGAEDYSGSTKGVLLEAGTYYIGVESTNAKKGGDADYSVTLNGNSTFFTEGDNTDDDWTTAPRLAAGDALAGWVGFGDAVDYRTVTVDARGGFYSFQLSDVENNVKLSVYSVNAKGKLTKVKSVSATEKNSDVSTGPLVLAGDTQYLLEIEATGVSSVKNSHYTVTMENLGLFFGEDNNSWDTATAIDGEYLGCLGKGAGADTVDYFDLSSWKNGFELEMEAGKVKASFYNAEHKAVKLPTILCADGKVKSNVSSLSLLDGNATTDTIQIAAFDESVKYLKIKAEASGMNSYRIGMLA